MSKKIEYSIILFLIGVLVLLFMWTETGRYNYGTLFNSPVMVDTRTGDLWFMNIETENSVKESEWVKMPSIPKEDSYGINIKKKE